MHPEHTQSQPADSSSTVGSFGFTSLSLLFQVGGAAQHPLRNIPRIPVFFFPPCPGRFNRELNETHLFKERLPFHWLWPRRDEKL